MITLTTDGSGNATDDSVILKAGERYAFQWASDVLSGPAAGAIALASVWLPDEDAAPGFYESDGTLIAYDLAAADGGGFEFVAAHYSKFRINVTGAGIADILHFPVAPVL